MTNGEKLSGEQMDFPNTFDEFAKDYGFRDKKEIYTNGSELIPVFRVKQWLEHISRVDAIRVASGYCHPSNVAKELAKLPPVTSQEPRWIPVSERLPDTIDKVLCWYEYYHWSQKKVLPEYGLGRYLRETSTWFGEVANGKDVRVIAWMPLPKPYKAESEEQ